MEENGIKQVQTRSRVEVVNLAKGKYNKDKMIQAEVRQVVETTTSYPSTKITNSLNDALFSTDEYGIAEQTFKSLEKRVAWLNVPESATKESVQAKIAPDAVLYRILSNHPILSAEDEAVLNDPKFDVSLDTYADSQIARYPEGHEKAGTIILDNLGKPMYRRIAFANKKVKDRDIRTQDPSDFYMSPKIQAELEQVPTVIPEQQI